MDEFIRYLEKEFQSDSGIMEEQANDILNLCRGFDMMFDGLDLIGKFQDKYNVEELKNIPDMKDIEPLREQVKNALKESCIQPLRKHMKIWNMKRWNFKNFQKISKKC